LLKEFWKKLNMIIKASGKYLRGSPRKARLVAKSVIGLTAGKAVAKLRFMTKRPADLILKVVLQGVANAKNNLKLAKPEEIKIVNILVDEGPRMKRQDRSHGARFDSGIIRKRFYHLTVIFESKEEAVLPAPESIKLAGELKKSGQ